MDWEHWTRRGLHLTTPLFLIYYWLPDPVIPDGPKNVVGLAIIIVSILFFELMRRALKVQVVCMRGYEMNRMAAYFWASLGLTVLFLFIPKEVAIPAVLGIAFVDPLIGELRSQESTAYPKVPLAVYFVLTVLPLTVMFGLDIIVLLGAVLVTPLAIWVESKRVWRLDDDFTMMVLPALFLYAWLSAFGML